jgi:hypothetical protein
MYSYLGPATEEKNFPMHNPTTEQWPQISTEQQSEVSMNGFHRRFQYDNDVSLLLFPSVQAKKAAKGKE